MQFVQREAELHHVSVYQTTLEIPMLPADQSVSSMLIVLLPSSAEIFTVLILADQVHVVSMLSAERGMVQLLVSATLVSREIPMWSASMSVPSTQSVPPTWHVSAISAEIPVQESVELMPPAMSTTISHHAPVTQATQETPSLHATESQH